jgi:hypothetical protein
MTIIEDNRVYQAKTELVSTSHYKPLQTILTNKVMTNQISVTVTQDGVQNTLVGSKEAIFKMLDRLGVNSTNVNIPGYYYSESRGEFLEISTLSTTHITNILNKLLGKQSKGAELLNELQVRSLKQTSL